MPTPNYDPLRDLTEASQAGTALGAQMALNSYRNQNLSLQIQQLKSEDAVRRAQIAMHNQQLSDMLYKHDLDVQEKADTMKAMARVQAEIAPTVTAPIPFIDQPDQGSPTTTELPNPNRVPFEQSMMKNMLPVIAKYQPDKVAPFVSDLAMYPYRLAGAKRQDALAGMLTSGGGAGAIKTITAENGQQYHVYTHPNGTTELVGQGDPKPVTIDGRTYLPDKTGNWKALAASNSEIMNRMTAKALNDMATKAQDLSVENPAAPGMRMIDPNKWEEFAKRESLPTGTRTKIETQQAEASRVFGLGQRLADVLTPENVGVKGNITRLSEGLASQLIPGYKIGTATDAVTLAKEYNSALVRGMKSDSNIAEPERASIQAALPDPTAWSKGAPQAKATLATTLEQWGNISRQNAETLGKPVTMWWLTPDEVFQKLQSGQIDKKQADDMMLNNGWNLIKKLRVSALRDAETPFNTSRPSGASLRR